VDKNCRQQFHHSADGVLVTPDGQPSDPSRVGLLRQMIIINNTSADPWQYDPIRVIVQLLIYCVTFFLRQI
jgi:hypothetical protein